MRRGKLVALVALAATMMLLAAPVGTAAPGFTTKTKPMLSLGPDAPPGSLVKAIISSGDEFGSFTFEGIPDGIGFVPNDDGTVDVFVTHEQSRVPFPVASPTQTGLQDFEDASISRLTIKLSNKKVLDADVVLPPDEGFIRFCSAFMAGPDEGFDSYVFFANEESNDVLDVQAGARYGPDPFYAPAERRQAGYVVYYDVESGDYAPIPGMGRHNHENTVIVPGGWDEIVALSGDDTFNAPSSQVYLYAAEDPDALLADEGTLYAFQVTETGGDPIDVADPFNEANDYGDIEVGDEWQGEFIEVPEDVAKGTLTTASPQDGLENWSNENNIFQFIRVEDIAYDRNDPNVVYLADTGERRAIANETTGRLQRGPSGTDGPYPNGRIFRLELNPEDPLEVLSFSILLDADAGGFGNPDVMHAPDNIDTSVKSLMVQEDSSQPPNSRIWRYDFDSETWSVVASVNGAAWESSGVVDASSVLGSGWWFVDVQAHDVFVDQSGPIPDPGTTVEKREGGQLLAVRFPGT